MFQTFADFEECLKFKKGGIAAGLQAGLQAAVNKAFLPPELNRPPPASTPHDASSLVASDAHGDCDVALKQVDLKDDLRKKSWEPDAEGKHCHMESIMFQDAADDPKKRTGEVQVYWNNVAPSAPDFVENIMMSSKYWNLLPPSLIVSVTGNAEDFNVTGELNPCDQPFVLFDIRTGPDEDGLVFPHVPIRIASGRSSASSQSDSLVDCLYRISDFLSKDDNLPQLKELSDRAEGMEYAMGSFKKWGHKLAHTARALKFWKPENDPKNPKTDPNTPTRSKDVTIRLKLLAPDNTAATMPGIGSAEAAKKDENQTKEDAIRIELAVFASAVQKKPEELEAQLAEFESQGFIYLKVVFECKHDSAADVVAAIVKDSSRPSFAQKCIIWGVNQDSKKTENPEQSILKMFSYFLKRVRLYDVVTVTLSPDAIEEDISTKKIIIETLLDDNESVDIRSKNIFESFNFKETSVGYLNTYTCDSYRDSFGDLKRRIENLSLDISVKEKDSNSLNYRSRSVCDVVSLPRPIWESSTLLLHKEGDAFEVFDAEDFDYFLNNKAKSHNVRLVRTQGNGCRMTSEMIERHLQELAFLLPLQFGPIWIITGANDVGIMKLCGNVFASLAGRGDNRSPYPQIALIGIAVAGPILDKQEMRTDAGLASFGIASGETPRHFCSILKDSGDEWTLRKTITRHKDKGKLFVNMDHTHMCLVGGIDGTFGGEVAFRNELESHAAQKFNIPLVQFVFGGGPMSMNNITGTLRSPRAYSCIIKGSGFFCYAVERFKELQDALEKHAKKNPTRALLKVPLKTPPSKDVSNNQLFQLKNINDHERFCVLPS